jgi:hypothetical protein
LRSRPRGPLALGWEVMGGGWRLKSAVSRRMVVCAGGVEGMNFELGRPNHLVRLDRGQTGVVDVVAYDANCSFTAAALWRAR